MKNIIYKVLRIVGHKEIFFSVLHAQNLEEPTSCQLNVYKTSEELKNLGKELTYFLDASKVEPLKDPPSTSNIRAETMFNTLIHTISQGNSERFVEKFIKFDPNSFYTNEKEHKTLLSNIEKFFTNYYAKVINSNLPITQAPNPTENTKDETFNTSSISRAVAYNKILLILYRVASEQSSYRGSSVFQTNYILNTALKILQKTVNPAPLLQYFLESMLHQKDIRSLIKKIAVISLPEYKKNVKIINEDSLAQQLRCIASFQQTADDAQEEKENQTGEDVPTLSPSEVLEIFFLNEIKNTRMKSGARKRLIKYMQNKEYQKEIKDQKWIENTELIHKIIQALNDYDSRNESQHSRYSDSYSQNRSDMSPIRGSSGSRDNSRISIQGAGLLGFGIDSSVERSNDGNEDKKEQSPKFTTSFFKRLNQKKIDYEFKVFLKKQKKLKRNKSPTLEAE